MKIVSVTVNGYEEGEMDMYLYEIPDSKDFREILADALKDMGVDNARVGYMVYLIEHDPEYFKKYGMRKVNAESVSFHTWEYV